jgi:hypothetical protein
MQQLIYAMQFKSRAVPEEAQPGVIHVRGDAASSSITTVINDGGLTGGFDPAAVALAHFESDVTIGQDGTFTEVGSITFGNSRNRLYFKTAGRGWMNDSPDSAFKQGAVTWTVERGEGQFAGGGGVITSNFTLDKEGEVSDYQLGVLYIP